MQVMALFLEACKPAADTSVGHKWAYRGAMTSCPPWSGAGAAQVVRAPVGLAVVKVLGLVPEVDRRAALPGVLQAVANLLKARHQGVR